MKNPCDTDFTAYGSFTALDQAAYRVVWLWSNKQFIWSNRGVLFEALGASSGAILGLIRGELARNGVKR